MPLYFFDSGDRDCFLHSDTGVELPSPQVACDEAVRLLPTIAHDMGLGYGGQDIVSTVRNEQNQVIFKATLSLRAEWLAPHLGEGRRVGNDHTGEHPQPPWQGRAPSLQPGLAQCLRVLLCLAKNPRRGVSADL